MTTVLHNGIGALLGDELARVKPLMVSGNVWFVQSTTGTDAVSPAGLNREKPLATLAQAVTNAADGDIVVLLSAHTETLTSTLTIGKRLIILGEGSSGGRPTVRLNQGADVVLLALTVTRIELRNIFFPEPTLAVTTRRVQLSATDCVVSGCYFELGSKSGAAGIHLLSGADRTLIEDTTLISTGTSTSLQPAVGVYIASAVSDVKVEGLILSDGSYGFSGVYAWDSSTAIVTRLYAKNISLLLGADMKLHASTTGFVNIGTATGGGKVTW